MFRRNQKCYLIKKGSLKYPEKKLDDDSFINLLCKFELVIDENNRMIYYLGNPAKLTKTEFKFLHTLIKHKGKHYSVDYIVKIVSDKVSKDNSLKYVQNIKSKIKGKLKKNAPSIIIPCSEVEWFNISNEIEDIRIKSKSSIINNSLNVKLNEFNCAGIKRDGQATDVGYENIKNYPKFDFNGQFNKLICISNKKIYTSIKRLNFTD